MTLGELREELATALKTITDEWDYESQQILLIRLGINRLDLIINRSRALSDDEVSSIREALTRRLNREPLQYILKTQGFMGEIYYVAEGALIPRHDTESLVENALETLADLKTPEILDIGTGSGAIIISLLKKMPGAIGVGVDISDSALAIARHNSLALAVENRIELIKSDLFSAIPPKTFDLIISNPPYIPIGDKASLQPEITEYEPEIALYGGEDGYVFYRCIIPKALEYLKPSGWLMFEAGHDQAETIREMMCDAGYLNVSCFSDLRGVMRFIKGQKF